MNTTISNTAISEEQLARASHISTEIRQQVSNAVVGQADVIDQVVCALIAAGHVLIEGVPGLGKTLLVRALAQTFGGRFARIQFTPDLMPGRNRSSRPPARRDPGPTASGATTPGRR